jgi:hypothetical protein
MVDGTLADHGKTSASGTAVVEVGNKLIVVEASTDDASQELGWDDEATNDLAVAIVNRGYIFQDLYKNYSVCPTSAPRQPHPPTSGSEFFCVFGAAHTTYQADSHSPWRPNSTSTASSGGFRSCTRTFSSTSTFLVNRDFLVCGEIDCVWHLREVFGHDTVHPNAP